MKGTNHIIELLVREREGKLTAEEKLHLVQWLMVPRNKQLYDKLQNKENEKLALESMRAYDVGTGLDSVLKQIKPQREKKTQVYQYATVVAACLLVFMMLTVYILRWGATNTPEQIPPGRDMAFLILEDGTKIALDSVAQNVQLSRHVRVFKDDNQQLVYKFFGQEAGVPGIHTIQTPRGGQYVVILPDGSKVWLNAESSLEYPVDFLSNRTVKLKGEAYFDVKKIGTKEAGLSRFTVELPDHKLEVLGTQFNVNSYTDKPFTETTLVEGRVKVLSGTIDKELLPGQQAIVPRGKEPVILQRVDTRQFSDWKDGFFYFDNTPIQQIMEKVAKWYDVEVAYTGKITKEGFGGEISRFENLEELLQLLEMTEKVHFKVEGRRVIVMP